MCTNSKKVHLNWFNVNSLAANPPKFQVIFPGNPNFNIKFLNINCHILSSSIVVKLLGIDDKLSFLHDSKGYAFAIYKCKQQDQSPY